VSVGKRLPLGQNGLQCMWSAEHSRNANETVEGYVAAVEWVVCCVSNVFGKSP
jgi:hypothetical protein